MGLFSWLRGVKKRAEIPQTAQQKEDVRRAAVRAKIGASVRPNQGPMSMGYLHPVSRKRNQVKSKRGYPVHVDAAFDPDENASFLLGLKVPCRSSWVESAQWNEESEVMTLTIDGKGYDFPGMDYGKMIVFSGAQSKGRWFWSVWRGQNERNEFHELQAGMRLP